MLSLPFPEAAKAIIVTGDSTLVIDFYNRAASPNKPSFVKQMKRMHALLKQSSIPIYFQHVAREYNKLADWLTNIPRSLGHNVDVISLYPDITLYSDPPANIPSL